MYHHLSFPDLRIFSQPLSIAPAVLSAKDSHPTSDAELCVLLEGSDWELPSLRSILWPLPRPQPQLGWNLSSMLPGPLELPSLVDFSYSIVCVPYMIPCLCPLHDKEIFKDLDQVLSIFVILDSCLAHCRCSKNIHAVNEWVNEQKIARI